MTPLVDFQLYKDRFNRPKDHAILNSFVEMLVLSAKRDLMHPPQHMGILTST